MTTLRIAVESTDGTDTDWTELTDGDPAVPVARVRAASLGEAQTATLRTIGPVFVDIDVHLADSVRSAFDEYGRANPGWTPGARVGTIVHPGTVATLVGLLGDIAAARVAHGVTLRGPDRGGLIRRVTDEIAPALGVRTHAVLVSAG